MDEGAPNFHVPTEKLPLYREFMKKIQPKSLTRRFIIDCHNGITYHYNEYNLTDRDGGYESDEDILKYLRNEIFKFKKCKLYSCFEVSGDYSKDELEKMPPDKMMEYMRLVYYNPEFEPLSAYSKMY